MRYMRLLVVGVSLLLGGPAAATAIPYSFVSGSALLEVEVDGFSVISTSAPLVGTFTTFDDMVPEITDLQWDVSDVIDLGFLLGMLSIDVTVVDGSPFSAPAASTGSGTWDWAGGEFDVSAMVSLTGGFLGDFGPLAIADTIPSASGTVSISGNTATFTAEKEKIFSFVHAGKTVSVFKSLTFVGVPEPATTALVALGLAFVAARARRRS